MFNTIQEIVEDIKLGRMVVVVDDEDRENEGDLVMAASFVKPDDINFMAKLGRGLICVPMDGKRLDELALYPMVLTPPDQYKTAWAISVDAKENITTGISAKDRATTIQLLSNPKAESKHLIRPGHVFPLRPREGGVLVRAGHTEACVDLLNLAGLYPVGVICEIMNEDGTMARLPDLVKFSKKFNLKIATIANLIKYRRKSDKLVKRIATTTLPTEATSFGTLTRTEPSSHVPESSGRSMSRKSGVQSSTAKLARKIDTPKVTTSWASIGPPITLLTAKR